MLSPLCQHSDRATQDFAGSHPKLEQSSFDNTQETLSCSEDAQSLICHSRCPRGAEPSCKTRGRQASYLEDSKPRRCPSPPLPFHPYRWSVRQLFGPGGRCPALRYIRL